MSENSPFKPAVPKELTFHWILLEAKGLGKYMLQILQADVWKKDCANFPCEHNRLKINFQYFFNDDLNISFEQTSNRLDLQAGSSI